jgi:hypothetical protein
MTNMARARNIKPAFFKNEDLADLGYSTMILFAGLWTLADKLGRLEDRPRRIKAEVLPYGRDVNVDDMLQELAAKGFLNRYEVNGSRYIQITSWNRHQSPHVKEAASIIPAPGKARSSTMPVPEKPRESSCEHHANSPSSLIPSSLIPSSLIPPSPKPKPGLAPEKPEGDIVANRFSDFWDLYPNKIGKDMTTQVWLSVVGPEEVDEVFHGLRRWLSSHQWVTKKMIQKPENWLSQKLWKDDPPNVEQMRQPSAVEQTLEVLKNAH